MELTKYQSRYGSGGIFHKEEVAATMARLAQSKKLAEENQRAIRKAHEEMGLGVPQINSFQPFQSPVDGKMITNRADLEGHNREHGVQQVGDEYVNKREEYLEKTNAKMDVDDSLDITTDIDVINQLKGN